MQKEMPALYRACDVEGCSRPHQARGYCLAHWKRWRRWGDPEGSRTIVPVDERFWKHVEKSDGCWAWTGGKTSAGYGLFHPRKDESVLAHRWVYELTNGAIPEGFVVDHTCHNGSSCPPGMCPHRLCVNPDHLETTSISENVSRSHNSNRNKTRCPRGHEYTEENTRYQSKANTISRSCKTCSRARPQPRVG